jgi:peptide chain release factor 3
MKLEQERGNLGHVQRPPVRVGGHQVNLLDTPGHADFSEDTYRTLIAADSAVMLLDNRKGVEERTRQLFEVCHRRRTPIFVFVNKCDRPGRSAEASGRRGRRARAACFPVTWPITEGDRLVGVYDRVERRAHLFERGDHGQRRAKRADRRPRGGEHSGADRDRGAPEAGGGDRAARRGRRRVRPGRVLDGRLSPAYFGSALTNFGVEPFLRHFLDLAPPPGPRESSAGAVDPTTRTFTGFVFKIQANMDPRHRDRIAFVRICSGGSRAGMHGVELAERQADPPRATAAVPGAGAPHVEEAWPGDVIGVHDRGSLRIGDTLSEDGTLRIERMPHFSPEHFARISVPDPLRRKHLDKGLRQLSEEGAAQVFYATTQAGPEPIVGAVGRLQFDVLLHRLEHEYGVKATLQGLPWKHARWVEGPEPAIRSVGSGKGRALVYDAGNRPLVLFDSEWELRHALERERELRYHDVAP